MSETLWNMVTEWIWSKERTGVEPHADILQIINLNMYQQICFQGKAS